MKEIIIRSVEPLSEEELHEALSSLSEDHPVWRAINDILLAEIENAASQMTSPEMAGNHGGLAHCAGGVEWLQGALHKFYVARNKRDTPSRMPRWLRNWLPE